MRCNNKEFLFDEQSFRLFLNLLDEARDKHKIRLYNYCLMTNHVHLLFQVPADDALSRFMHRLANGFAKRFNSLRGRKGHLWEGRFVSTIVDARTYFLRCMAYIDLNPVRARMAAAPGDYEWGGHRHVAAENEAAVSMHRVYLELGKTRTARCRAYTKMLDVEAARQPYSLAGTLFVGSRGFTRRLQKRFGITVDARPHVRSVDLEGGVCAIERDKGAGHREFTRKA